MSATGTYWPSIWQEELPICSLAMSLRAGNLVQPLSAAAAGSFRVAPQLGQADWEASASAPHQSQRPPAATAAGREGGGCRGGRPLRLVRGRRRRFPVRLSQLRRHSKAAGGRRGKRLDQVAGAQGHGQAADRQFLLPDRG